MNQGSLAPWPLFSALLPPYMNEVDPLYFWKLIACPTPCHPSIPAMQPFLLGLKHANALLHAGPVHTSFLLSKTVSIDRATYSSSFSLSLNDTSGEFSSSTIPTKIGSSFSLLFSATVPLLPHWHSSQFELLFYLFPDFLFAFITRPEVRIMTDTK